MPPLKPIENSRYNEMNLPIDRGISRSEWIEEAKIPRKKANVGALKILVIG